MKKYVSVLVFTLLAFGALAQAEHEIAPGVIAIDESGKSVLLRDKQNAALVFTGDIAKELSEKVKSQPGSPLHCGKGFCAVGQISRDGRLSPLTNKFALRNHFRKFINEHQEYFKTTESTAYAYPSQCQDLQMHNLDLEQITVKGRAAEELYNFLLVKAGPGERGGSPSKYGADKLIFCEKNPQYNDNDLSTGGAPLYPPSYHEYECYLSFDKSGTPVPRHGCNIYAPPAPNEGGGSSAGGGHQ